MEIKISTISGASPCFLRASPRLLLSIARCVPGHARRRDTRHCSPRRRQRPLCGPGGQRRSWRALSRQRMRSSAAARTRPTSCTRLRGRMAPTLSRSTCWSDRRPADNGWTTATAGQRLAGRLTGGDEATGSDRQALNGKQMVPIDPPLTVLRAPPEHATKVPRTRGLKIAVKSNFCPRDRYRA